MVYTLPDACNLHRCTNYRSAYVFLCTSTFPEHVYSELYTPKYHTYCYFLAKCLVLGRTLSDHSTQHFPTLRNHNCTYMTHELCMNPDPCSTSFCQRSTPPM
ncbi:hypothetical protein BDL97_03G047000 [Sphagnum fallax]|nr:hypothetical protein BDL97_03G047000 [Sphagnum fallax]